MNADLRLYSGQIRWSFQIFGQHASLSRRLQSFCKRNRKIFSQALEYESRNTIWANGFWFIECFQQLEGIPWSQGNKLIELWIWESEEGRINAYLGKDILFLESLSEAISFFLRGRYPCIISPERRNWRQFWFLFKKLSICTPPSLAALTQLGYLFFQLGNVFLIFFIYNNWTPISLIFP